MKAPIFSFLAIVGAVIALAVAGVVALRSVDFSHHHINPVPGQIRQLATAVIIYNAEHDVMPATIAEAVVGDDGLKRQISAMEMLYKKPIDRLVLYNQYALHDGDVLLVDAIESRTIVYRDGTTKTIAKDK